VLDRLSKDGMLASMVCKIIMLFDFAANMEQKTLFQIKGCRNQVGALILNVAITSMDLFLTMYVLQEYRIVPVDQ